MGVYEGHIGDKDARDSQDMRNSDQFKKHGNIDEKIGDFEKHTKVRDDIFVTVTFTVLALTDWLVDFFILL